MPKVFIGKEYQSAFNSILELYRNGFVSKGIVESVDPVAREIVYRGTTFALDRTDSRNVDRSYVMEDDGASWFRAVREQSEIDSGASDWLSLISDVADDYHKLNSFLVFKQRERTFDVRRIDEHKKYIGNLIRTLFPEQNEYRVVFKNNDPAAEVDVFAINFMMDVNSGVGEAKKVLGKVYFKYVNRRFYLLDKHEGEEIEKQVNSIIETDDFENAEVDHDHEKKRVIVNDVMAALDNVIKQNDFSKSVIFTGRKDLKIINDFVENGPQMNVQLDCSRLKVIGIYHIRWSNLFYQVEDHSIPLLNVQVTSDNKMTVSCARCAGQDDAVIAVDDRIEFEENGKKTTFLLDPSKEGLGLTSDRIRAIRETSNTARHMIPVFCNNVELRSRDGLCKKTVCVSSSFEYDGRRYCRDCAHPTIVCEDVDRESKITDTLAYASDVRAFVSSEKLRQCPLCGRMFLLPFPAGSAECSLCEKICSDHVAESDNVINGYRDLFPLAKRLLMFVSRSESAAVQDREIIVFRLRMFGKNRFYLSHKLEMQKKGYLGGPKKIKGYLGNRVPGRREE